MKLKVYHHSHDVPEKYYKALRRLGLQYGSIRWMFFDDLKVDRKVSAIHEIVIVVDNNDTPISWGLMNKGDNYSYKNAMFYTQKDYRRQGLASKIYNSMCQRHKKFTVYPDSRNKGFFESCGRNVKEWD